MAAYGQGQKNTTMLGGGKENKRKEKFAGLQFSGFLSGVSCCEQRKKYQKTAKNTRAVFRMCCTRYVFMLNVIIRHGKQLRLALSHRVYRDSRYKVDLEQHVRWFF